MRTETSNFSVVASVVAFAAYALLPVDRMPLPMTAVVVAVDFIIAPPGVLTGGLFDPRRAPFHAANAY
jgi:hypothetical protein